MFIIYIYVLFHYNFFFVSVFFILHSEFDGVLLDFSRQRATLETMDKLFKLGEVGFAYICVFML